jgi:hypothetical protein
VIIKHSKNVASLDFAESQNYENNNTIQSIDTNITELKELRKNYIEEDENNEVQT